MVLSFQIYVIVEATGTKEEEYRVIITKQV